MTSVMEGSYNFLLDIIKLSQCNKRKQNVTKPQAKPLQTPPSWQKMGARRKKSVRCDSDESLASTEPGDSTNEFSDKSYHTDTSTGWSSQGTRGPKTMSTQFRNAPMRAPPGLDAPPGLEAFGPPQGFPAWQRPDTRLNAEAPSFVPGHAGPHLNPDTPAFVPSLGAVASAVDQGLAQGGGPEAHKSQQLRQSIQMLKGALAEWEANLPETKASSVQQPPPAPSDNLAVLQQALTKLSPEQASVVRTFLDKKANQSTPGLIKDALQQGAQKGPFAPAGRSQPAGMQRPFTPFVGNRTSTEQVKRPKTAALYRQGKPVLEGCDESLRDHLRELAELQSSRVLMVRRINRLGLDSPSILKEYFSRFGTVDRVMVAHTRCKAKGLEKARVRPAPLGFVVLSKTEEANAALAPGSEHSVNGVDIGVFSFESHPIDESEKA